MKRPLDYSFFGQVPNFFSNQICNLDMGQAKRCGNSILLVPRMPGAQQRSSVASAHCAVVLWERGPVMMMLIKDAYVR